MAGLARPRGLPVATGVSVVTSLAYRALARAVLLQAVKDCASRVEAANGGLRYRDHGRRTDVADSARTFLSTVNPELTFWCLWLDIHPETIMAGAKVLPTGLPALETPPLMACVH